MTTARTLLLVSAATAAASLATAGAMTRTSATFDETVLVAGGVRGMQRGVWDMITSQPPVMMYLYGAAAGAGPVALPSEASDRPIVQQGWDYARSLFFRVGNDPVVLLRRARWVGVAVVGLLVLASASYATWIAGPVAGALAAIMVAATPDVLAHGGVAYNDLPLALAFLLAVWGLDLVLRTPSPGRAAAAGALVALALAVKLSALAVAPVAVLLLVTAALVRPRDRMSAWKLGAAITAGGLSLWATLTILYRADPTLALFRLGLFRTMLHAEGGHPGAAYLLGRTSPDGWWFFFPVAFFFKTPAAFQGLLLLGAIGLLRGRRREEGQEAAWKRAMRWRGRGPLLGAGVFGGFLMGSHLNAGFRYALPVLPLLAILAATGLARLWRSSSIRGRGGVVLLLALQVLSVATAYPHLLAYTSVWAGDRDRADRVLLDSSLDWGQGLLELRDFMEDEDVRRVSLSYFGSAMPEAYGIDYVPLPSFFRLEGGEAREPGPRFTVISATTLHGLYLQGHDPFAAYRSRPPYRVLGHTMFVYDEHATRSHMPAPEGEASRVP